MLHEQTGEASYLERALADSDHAVQLEPLNPWMHWGRAHLFERLERAPDRLAAIQRAVELDRPDGGWFRQRALERARDWLALRGREEPENRELLATRALIALALGEAQEARETAEQVLELDPRHPEALAVRGELALQRGEVDAALRDFEQALQLRPASFRAASGIARALQAKGERDAAAAACATAVDLAETEWQRVELRRGFR